MTTKKARSRRLVRINGTRDPYCSTLSIQAGETETFVRPYHGALLAYLATGEAVSAILKAPTRLALHDAILRAGWPSPWHEVGTTLTAPFVADMRAAGWTTKLDTVFRENKCAGTAEIMVDEIRVTASVFRDLILIRCRAPGTGPIGYRTAYTMTEWVNLGAAFFTAEAVRNFRQSLQTPAEFVWAPNLVPYPFHTGKP